MGWFSRKPEPTAAESPHTDWTARPDRAGRQRRAAHHRTGARRAAAAGEQWENADRARERDR